MARSNGGNEMQGWITLEAATTNAVIAQPKREWLDAGEYSDAYFVIDTAALTSVELFIETSPVDEEEYFVEVSGGSVSTTTNSPHHIYVKSSDTTPVLRYVRWRAAFSAADAKVTFRIMSIFKRR